MSTTKFSSGSRRKTSEQRGERGLTALRGGRKSLKPATCPGFGGERSGAPYGSQDRQIALNGGANSSRNLDISFASRVRQRADSAANPGAGKVCQANGGTGGERGKSPGSTNKHDLVSEWGKLALKKKSGKEKHRKVSEGKRNVLRH